MQNKLARFLKTKRQDAGLSQLEVANRLNYSSPQFISNWERGVSCPPLDKLHLLMNMYRVSKKEIIEIMLEDTKDYLESEISGRSKAVAAPKFR
jgi:transcriptional regulator with XRE-family HTH domain